MPTINNIDLSRKNNCNIVSVESEYDAAMSAAAREEREDPIGYAVREVRSLAWRDNYSDHKQVRSLLAYHATLGQKDEILTKAREDVRTAAFLDKHDIV